MTDELAALRFARSFAGSFFGWRSAFTARGVFAVCRCIAAILPLASPFSSRFYCRLRFVWRQQTISSPGVRPSCVHFYKKKSGTKVAESATAVRKTAAGASLFSSRGRLKRSKTGCTSVQNRNRAVRVVFLPIFLPRFHFQKVFYLLFLQQQFVTLPPSGLRRLFSITFKYKRYEFPYE